MPGLAAVQHLQNDLIRKINNQSVFITPWGNPAVDIDEATMFDPTTGEFIALPGTAGAYHDLGYIEQSGAVFARAVSTSDVSSAQSLTPTRTDITADTTTLALTPQETNQWTMTTYIGVDAAAIVPGTNGVTRIDKPATPTVRYYSAFSVAVDKQANGEIVIIRWLPKVSPTAYADQTHAANSDTPVTWGVTLTGYKDDALGFSETWVFGGAGWRARLAAMGFTP
jgi:hypothetical protein